MSLQTCMTFLLISEFLRIVLVSLFRAVTIYLFILSQGAVIQASTLEALTRQRMITLINQHLGIWEGNRS